MVALRHWHVYQGFPDPTKQPAVIKTLAGITRTHGKPREKASPIPAVIEFIEYIDTNHSGYQINCMSFDDFIVAEEGCEYG